MKTAAAIKAKMAGIEPRLPAGVSLHRYWDQTDLVVESQRSLRDAILIGAVLAILVILLFLRNLRMTLVAALVIPIAMAVSVFAMNRLGQTLNLMSVGGLAVAVGLIIDDAIVVIENVARNMHRFPQMRKADAIVLSMGELTAPMAASTFTTVVVFVPLLLLSGVSGFFFRALALTLAAALVVSLFSRAVRHAAALLVAHPSGRRAQRRDGIYRAPARRLRTAAAVGACSPARRVCRIRRRARDNAAAPLAFTQRLLAALGRGAVRGQVHDAGRNDDRGKRQCGNHTRASGGTRPCGYSVGRFTGIDTNGYSPTQVRQGTIRIRLRPQNQRAPYEAVSDRLRDAFSAAVPAAQLDFHQILEDMINDLSGSPSPVEITLTGPDQTRLVALANAITDRIATVNGIADTFSGVNYDDPALHVAPNGARLAALNMNAADFGSAVQAAAQGDVASSVPDSLNLVPVRVTLAGSGASLESTLLPTASGAVPLGSIAQIRTDRLSTDITEINGQRVMIITANYGGASLSSVIAGVRRALAQVPLPPGYATSIGGAYEAQQQSFREFLEVIVIAVALVYFLMLATFQSFRLPLVILTAIPLALIGVALGLFLTRTPFNVSSFMGLLLLVGLIVKNGILLIDVANRKRQEGAGVQEALLTAGRTRLRPIVMTTVAAIGGLLPLAFGIGAGAAMEQPLAIAVIGGLSTATIFTLVLIPVLYAGIAGRRRFV